MKSIACVILATLCAGCGHMNMGNFAAAMQGQQDYEARQQGYYPPPQQQRAPFSTQVQMPTQMTRTDFTCFNTCMQTGTLWGLCQKQCSY